MNLKVLITNLTALKAKYGTDGVKQINAAVKALIAADKARGFQTRLIAVDRATDMKRVKGKRVTQPADPKQNKEAVDAIYTALVPDYLVLLGAPDVIPHQDLLNPVFAGEDVDEFAFGDLPYACDAPYSQDPRDFLGPVRVVGRIPDLTAASDPAYLVGLLNLAAAWKSRSAADYAAYFSVSAEEWQESTKLSLEKLFNDSKSLQLSPSKGPKWTSAQLAPRVHFINCHGAEADPGFYGEGDDEMPLAHSASHVAGKLSEGLVAAVECCYGAELYDPSFTDGQAGICNTYLSSGAYGFFGSSTIAYGPAEGNGAADLLCQYFLRRVRMGASTGRATLEARLEFAGGAAELDPIDLKTLAQFHLLGDPSIHPVAGGTSMHTVSAPKKGARAASLPKTTGKRALAGALARDDRRRLLAVRGAAIAETQACAVPSKKTPAPALRAELQKLAADLKLKDAQFLSFTIQTPTGAMAKSIRAVSRTAAAAPSAFHVVLGAETVTTAAKLGGKAKARGGKSASAKGVTKAPMRLKPFVALVAREVAGQIVSYRTLHRR